MRGSFQPRRRGSHRLLWAVVVVAPLELVAVLAIPAMRHGQLGATLLPLTVLGWLVLWTQARQLRTPDPPVQHSRPAESSEQEPSAVLQAATEMARQGKSAARIAHTFDLPLAFAELLVAEAHRPRSRRG